MVPELSVAIPLYRERDVIPELVRRLVASLDALRMSWEIVLVDDGSDDDQWSLIEAASREHAGLRGVRLARNFGLQAAATAALASTRGRVVVLMDGDLQDPPELIGELIAKWRAGAEVVLTRKASRRENALKRLAFASFYRVFGWFGDVSLDDGGLFSLMDRKVVDAVLTLNERTRYLPALRAWTGFRRDELVFDRHARFAGRPQSTLRLMAMAFSALIAFSKAPLRLAIVCGVGFASLGFLAVGWIVWLKLSGRADIQGWSSTIATMLLIGGVQLAFLGVVAEYLGRVFDEVKGRPIYIVSESVGRSGEVESAAGRDPIA